MLCKKVDPKLYSFAKPIFKLKQTSALVVIFTHAFAAAKSQKFNFTFVNR